MKNIILYSSTEEKKQKNLKSIKKQFKLFNIEIIKEESDLFLIAKCDENLYKIKIKEYRNIKNKINNYIDLRKLNSYLITNNINDIVDFIKFRSTDKVLRTYNKDLITF